MTNKNFDAIKRQNKNTSANLKPAVFRIQSKQIKAPTLTITTISYTEIVKMPKQSSAGHFYSQKIPIMSAVAGLLISFIAGGWATLNTTASRADLEQVLAAKTSAPANYIIPLKNGGALGPVSSVPNDVLFNLPLDQLEDYMEEKNSGAKQAEILAQRKIKLKAYLEEKGSPLSLIVDTLAELKHWKLVLAISNSESSLGKRCYTNNCSGIGVEPGHPLWRTYNSKADWAKDLDNLLERRYKNWTLEKMNGVYNQPGSQNWLAAAKQILEDLQQREIE